MVWRMGPRHHGGSAWAVTGHGPSAVAVGVLRAYARFVDRGMLPNRFPNAGEAPEYNTVDAALWFFEAVRQYYAATHDLSLVREIFPSMAQIIGEYTRGTRYNIHVDSTDGLADRARGGGQTSRAEFSS